ncbi:MAG TPA: cytochrome C oxidase subunit IV family protein [Terriglobia bacterium]
MADHEHDHDQEHHPVNYRLYFKTWVWLLILTATALGLGYAPINESLKAFLLVCTTLAKILVIAAIFMHLRYERINLVLLTFVPLILAIIMFSFTYPETLGTATHLIRVH